MTEKVLVLYAPDPGAVVRHLAEMGMQFTPEKHGVGPDHFACAVGDHVLEVYPPRRNGNLEPKFLEY